MIDSPSSGERRGKSLNRRVHGRGGVVGPDTIDNAGTGSRLENGGAEGDTPVRATGGDLGWHLSRAGHVESCPNPRGPSRKAKDCRRPIANQYREGKVGSTPNRGVK